MRKVSIAAVAVVSIAVLYIWVITPDQDDLAVRSEPKTNDVSNVNSISPDEKTDAKNSVNVKSEGAPKLVVAADKIAESAVQPWVDEYRSHMQGSDYFEEYEIIAFDEDLLRELASGTVNEFQISFGRDSSLNMTVMGIEEVDDRWVLHANLENNPDSLGIFSIFPNGNRSGQIHAMDDGTYYIRPTNVMPYHILYALRGRIYAVD